MSVVSVRAIAAVAVLSACGSSATFDADATSDGGANADAFVITVADQLRAADPDPPAPPAAPVMTPCPSGWSTVEAHGVERCEPWPSGGVQLTCPPDQAHFPGEAACSQIGTACTGPWPADLPADRPLIFAVAGAAPGGDGTMAAPFATITEALAAAPAGAVIALGRSVFDETITLGTDTALIGACPAETRIISTSPSEMIGAIDVAGTGVEIRNLSAGGARMGVTVRDPASSVTIAGVLIDGAHRNGIATRGRVDARSIVVRNTSVDELGTRGNGFAGADGAIVTIDRAVFEENHSAGLAFGGAGTTAVLRNLAVVRTQPNTFDETQGTAVVAIDGASVTLETSAIEAAHHYGAYADGAELAIRSTIIRDTIPAPAAPYTGKGVTAAFGAHLVLERAVISRNRNHGVFVTEASSSTIADVIVEETTLTSPDSDGVGVVASAGSSLVAERVVLAANAELGVGLVDRVHATLEDLAVSASSGVYTDEDTVLTLTRASVTDARYFAIGIHGGTTSLADLSISGTRPIGTATIAYAIEVGRGASLGLERARLDDNARAGLHTSGEGTHAIVSHVRATGTRSIPGMTGNMFAPFEVARGSTLIASEIVAENNDGLAFAVSEDAVLDLSVARISGAGLVGIGAYGGLARLRDVRISDCAGRGFELARGGRIDAERTVLSAVSDVAIAALDPGSELGLEDVRVERTASRAEDGAFGYGLGVQDGARAVVSRAIFSENRSATLFVFGANTSLTANALAIEGPRRPTCDATGCFANLAMGISSDELASVQISRFLIHGSADAGVVLGPKGTVDLSDGEISGNSIGANVQNTEFDYARFMNVVFRDNAINLDSTSLPIPSPAVTELHSTENR